jgi:hypothetical protein
MRQTFGVLWLALPPMCCLIACEQDPPALELAVLEVDSATLSQAEISAGGVAMGYMRATAALSVKCVNGESHEFAVVLSGGNLGETGYWSSEANDPGERDLLGIGIELPKSKRVTVDDAGSRPLTIGDLFGRYKGMGAGMHALLGAAIYTFSNSADVEIWLGGVTPGIGVDFGLADMRLGVANP